VRDHDDNEFGDLSVQHKQCALTIFAARLTDGLATEASKNPQVAAIAVTTLGAW